MADDAMGFPVPPLPFPDKETCQLMGATIENIGQRVGTIIQGDIKTGETIGKAIVGVAINQANKAKTHVVNSVMSGFRKLAGSRLGRALQVAAGIASGNPKVPTTPTDVTGMGVATQQVEPKPQGKAAAKENEEQRPTSEGGGGQ